MADKPSRALILFGYGVAHSIKPSHAHIHAVASQGCCGFLALDHLPPSENEDEELLRELTQLFDAHNANQDEVGEKSYKSENQKIVPTISERFMGMKAAIVSNSSAVKCLGETLGFVGIELDKFGNGESFINVTAYELLKLLGFEEGKTLETPTQFDLVFVHIGPRETLIGQEVVPTARETVYINNLVGQILQISRHSSAIRSRLHLSLVMSYGVASEENPSVSLLSLQGEKNSDLSVLFPSQSYSMRGGKLRTNIRNDCPLLVAQWQEAVTRRDKVKMLSFDDIRKVFPSGLLHELLLPCLFLSAHTEIFVISQSHIGG
ncbi:hypothetical protein Dimus_035166 [Dionaea muscipula]